MIMPLCKNSLKLGSVQKCVAENLPFGLTASLLNFNKSLSSAELKEFFAKLNSLEFDETMTETMSGVNCKYCKTMMQMIFLISIQALIIFLCFT